MLKIVAIVILWAMVFLVQAADFQVITNCRVSDLHGKLIKDFDGYMCSFYEDGSHLVSKLGILEMRNDRGQTIWFRNGLYHHQLKNDRERIVILSETSHDFFGCSTRFDTVEVLERKSGKLIRVLDLFNDYEKLIGLSSEEVVLRKAGFQKLIGRYRCDTTHVNSIYQLKNDFSYSNKTIPAGSWMINVQGLGIIVFYDNNLVKLIGGINWKEYFQSNMIHDVQIINDKIVLYANDVRINDQLIRKSAIVELNLKAKKVDVFYFQIKGKNSYQPKSGGFDFNPQNGDWYISSYDETDGFNVAVYNKNKKIKFNFTPIPKGIAGKGLVFQEPKLHNLESFFKNYKGF